MCQEIQLRTECSPSNMHMNSVQYYQGRAYSLTNAQLDDLMNTGVIQLFNGRKGNRIIRIKVDDFLSSISR